MKLETIKGHPHHYILVILSTPITIIRALALFHYFIVVWYTVTMLRRRLVNN
jgi:hypothetical protein